MFRICIVTSGRADYYLLRPLIKKMIADIDFDTRIVATGAHLSESQGMTVTAIENDGIPIDARIDVFSNDDTLAEENRAIARAIEAFDGYFAERNPDMLIVLGDRFEMLGVATAAFVRRIPIAHIHGGEVTQGAIDDSIRHSITKMSELHFTCCQAYRHRVIQMGEHPSRVFDVGALGVENALAADLLAKSDLELSLGMKLGDLSALVTLHPETASRQEPSDAAHNLVSALERYPEMSVIITKANADAGGSVINAIFEDAVSRHESWALFSNLGMIRYLSAMSIVSVMVGNTSSGVLESPSFGVPVVNIGMRQAGRVRAANIIDCQADEKSIFDAISISLTDDFRAKAKKCTSPFGSGGTSARIIESVRAYLEAVPSMAKTFYDIDFEEE